MNGSSRVIARLFVLLSLFVALVLPTAAQSAPRLVLTLSMVEYAYPAGRVGTIKIYVPDFASPFGGNPDFREFDTGFWVITDWGSLGACNSSFLAGGHQEGWLLGPVTDVTTLRYLHPSANTLFGVLTGYFGDTGFANRYSCSGAALPEIWSILYIFLLPQSTFVQGQGYHVGDVLYSTDLNPSGNWYYLYSSSAP